MAINLRAPDVTELKPRIVVFGVGGAGGNAVNNMIEASLEGVEFAVANTDAQSLAHSRAGAKIQLGQKLTEGLGAGSRPEVGASAAEESLEDIREALAGSHMVFITAGMGGGTGTGAAPVIARAARDLGILTVGVVTKPFAFEGQRRGRLAEEGIARLQASVDTLIIIPNQNLFRVATDKTTFAKAFQMADDVLYSGVRGITDLMVMPGLINLDFADVRTIMNEMGKAMMGTGEAEGPGRALHAAEAAISNPLLDHSSMKGARGVLINITGGNDLTLFEVDEAANKIRAEVDPDANIIVGSSFDERLEGRMRVSVVATGIETEALRAPMPASKTAIAAAARASDTGSAASPIAGNGVHVLQNELAQSGLAQPNAAAAQTPGEEAALLEARKVAARVAAESAAQAQLPPAAIRSARQAPAFDLTGHEAPDGDGRFDPRFGGHHAPRGYPAPEPAAEPKKKSALEFILGMGRSGLGIGTSPAAPATRREAAQPVVRRMLPPPAPLSVNPTPPLTTPPRLTAAKPGTPAVAPSAGGFEVKDDQLEIPAFLRRQAH
jgi:cell division protein FtsZ